MAQANLRLAAGIGIVAAFLLAGGPSAAVAIAEPGGSHSGHSGDRDRSGGGSDWGDANIANGTTGGQKASTGDGPRTRVGSGRDVGTSDERSGADYSPDRPGSLNPPKVTFGDGRTPGVQDDAPEPRWRGGAPEPAPPPPPPTAVVDILPAPRTDRTPKPPIIRQLVVAPAAGVSDPLFGLAGLLLIPVAGAILGYRHARAAQAAAELGRHP
ncbi:MAG: hypothetical protein QOJ20_1663 [Mycobacterium sp.]|nr:hypothetical protein [Mycobacterium sp.]